MFREHYRKVLHLLQSGFYKKKKTLSNKAFSSYVFLPVLLEKYYYVSKGQNIPSCESIFVEMVSMHTFCVLLNVQAI